jgi:hypothetical protein
MTILNLPEIPPRLPPFLSRKESEEWGAKVNYFIDSLPEFVEKVNAIIDYLNKESEIPHWDATILYQTGDLVKMENEIYIAIGKFERLRNDMNINQDPTSDNGYWDIHKHGKDS